MTWYIGTAGTGNWYARLVGEGGVTITNVVGFPTAADASVFTIRFALEYANNTAEQKRIAAAHAARADVEREIELLRALSDITPPGRSS